MQFGSKRNGHGNNGQTQIVLVLTKKTNTAWCTYFQILYNPIEEIAPNPIKIDPDSL
jgi:hypothetical protein